MSKWALLIFTAVAIGVAAYFFPAASAIRRSRARDPDFDQKVMHLPLEKREERAEWAKNYMPERAFAIAIGLALLLIFETIKAFRQ